MITRLVITAIEQAKLLCDLDLWILTIDIKSNCKPRYVRINLITKFGDLSSVNILLWDEHTKMKHKDILWPWPLTWTFDNKRKKDFFTNVKMNLNTKFGVPSSVHIRTLRWTYKNWALGTRWPWPLNWNFDKRKKKTFLDNLKKNSNTKFGDPSSIHVWALKWTKIQK